MKRCPQCNRVETDEALKFCRVDGATLINESGAVDEAGTAKFDATVSASSVIETSILPHRNDADISRSTGPTTVLPAPATPGAVRGLSKPKRLRVVILLVTLAVIAVVAGYFYFSRKSSTTIQSIAVMPFVNESGN